jgi:hypothetical protein
VSAQSENPGLEAGEGEEEEEESDGSNEEDEAAMRVPGDCAEVRVGVVVAEQRELDDEVEEVDKLEDDAQPEERHGAGQARNPARGRTARSRRWSHWLCPKP